MAVYGSTVAGNTLPERWPTAQRLQPTQWLRLCLCEGQFRHKQVGCSYAYDIEIPESCYYYFRTKIILFVAYLMTCVQRSLAIPCQMLTNLNSAGRSTWCLVGGIFGHKKADSDTWIPFLNPQDSIISKK